MIARKKPATPKRMLDVSMVVDNRHADAGLMGAVRVDAQAQVSHFL